MGRYRFWIEEYEEPDVGIFGGSGYVTISVDERIDGDPEELLTHLIDMLHEWYDGGSVTRIPDPTIGDAVDDYDLESALAYVRDGGSLYVQTHLRRWEIDARTLDNFEQNGERLLKPAEKGFHMRQGRSWMYLFPGQLKYGARK